MQLSARRDTELLEHFVQVVLDCARADEQPLADLRIGQTVASQARDTCLLRRELPAGLDCAAAHLFPGREVFAVRTLGKGLRTHRHERLLGGTQLRAGVDSSALTAQPLAVD